MDMEASVLWRANAQSNGVQLNRAAPWRETRGQVRFRLFDGGGIGRSTVELGDSVIKGGLELLNRLLGHI